MSEPAKLPIREAVHAMCRECIYDPLDKGAGGCREQVGACTTQGCPLWWYRLPGLLPSGIPDLRPCKTRRQDALGETCPPSGPSEPTESSTRCERTAEGLVSSTGANLGANGG